MDLVVQAPSYNNKHYTDGIYSIYYFQQCKITLFGVQRFVCNHAHCFELRDFGSRIPHDDYSCRVLTLLRTIIETLAPDKVKSCRYQHHGLHGSTNQPMIRATIKQLGGRTTVHGQRPHLMICNGCLTSYIQSLR